MACKNSNSRNCFTYVWTIQNASFCGHDVRVGILESPSFKLEEIHEAEWKLELHLMHSIREVDVFLFKQNQVENDEEIEVDCEFAFISPDGTVLYARESQNCVIEAGEEEYTKINDFASRKDIFIDRREVFLHQDTLTVRLRVWKSVGEISRNVMCFGCTRITVEKQNLMWHLRNFSTLQPGRRLINQVKRNGTEKLVLTLELFLTGGYVLDETIRITIIPYYDGIKSLAFRMCIVDAYKRVIKCFQDEFWDYDEIESKDFTLLYSKKELLEMKNTFLTNDVLCLLFECSFSDGSKSEDDKIVDIDCGFIRGKKPLDSTSDERRGFVFPKRILVEDLQTMMNSGCFSDVKLKTKDQTHPAHKCILSSRSPVFHVMFSNDMKEKNSNCVDIEDLNGDTVRRMLRYIYTAELENLEWRSAIELYEAADKYQLLDLKGLCSSYLKKSLCVNNVCEALIMANMHQDQDLKVAAQNFILSNGEDVIFSEDWDMLMESDWKLAAETMRLKFKK